MPTYTRKELYSIKSDLHVECACIVGELEYAWPIQNVPLIVHLTMVFIMWMDGPTVCPHNVANMR